MKKRLLWLQLTYYLLTLMLYVGFFKLISLLPALLGGALDVGTATAYSYAALFIVTPLLVIILMRFSLFKWYVDPIAAAIIPTYLYFGMVFGQSVYTGSLRSAFLLVNEELSDDGGMGWALFAVLFAFGLAASFSIARKKGKSVSYRIVKRLIDADAPHSEESKNE